jgi:diaminopimelate decarboxylase
MKTRGPIHRVARAVARRALRKAVRRLSPRDALPPSAWRLERDALGRLKLDGLTLQSVCEQLGTPLHVVDAVRLRENAARYTHCPAAHGDGVEIFYSYKTNPVPGVLRTLHRMGIGAATSSPFELWLAHTLGVPTERIVYHCPIWSPTSLREVLECGVGLINVNSRQELPALAAAARAANVRPRVGVRVCLPQVVPGPFGERLDDGSALQTFVEALERPELEVVALHAHFNTEIATRDDLRSLLAPLLRFAAQLRSRLRLDLQVLDLGGNLASPTVTRLSPARARVQMALGSEATPRPPHEVLTIDEYIGAATELIETHYRRAGRPMPRVCLEPGRSVTSNAQMLLLRVSSVRKPDDSDISTVLLDGGVNVADPLRTERHQVLPTTVRPGAEPRQYRLVGPTCSLADLLCPTVWLPRLEPGDLLAVMDSGAYFVPHSSCFSFPRPGVVMVDRGHLTVLRRPESFEDLVALDRLDLDEEHEPRRRALAHLDHPRPRGYDPDTELEAG